MLCHYPVRIFIVQRWCQPTLTHGTTPNTFTSNSACTKPAFPQIQSVNSWLTGANIVSRVYTGSLVLLCLYRVHKREGAGASSYPLSRSSALSLPIKIGDRAQGGNDPCFLAVSVLWKSSNMEQNTCFSVDVLIQQNLILGRCSLAGVSLQRERYH